MSFSLLLLLLCTMQAGVVNATIGSGPPSPETTALDSAVSTMLNSAALDATSQQVVTNEDAAQQSYGKLGVSPAAGRSRCNIEGPTNSVVTNHCGIDSVGKPVSPAVRIGGQSSLPTVEGPNEQETRKRVEQLAAQIVRLPENEKIRLSEAVQKLQQDPTVSTTSTSHQPIAPLAVGPKPAAQLPVVPEPAAKQNKLFVNCNFAIVTTAMPVMSKPETQEPESHEIRLVNEDGDSIAWTVKVTQKGQVSVPSGFPQALKRHVLEAHAQKYEQCNKQKVGERLEANFQPVVFCKKPDWTNDEKEYFQFALLCKDDSDPCLIRKFAAEWFGHSTTDVNKVSEVALGNRPAENPDYVLKFRIRDSNSPNWFHFTGYRFTDSALEDLQPTDCAVKDSQPTDSALEVSQPTEMRATVAYVTHGLYNGERKFRYRKFWFKCDTRFLHVPKKAPLYKTVTEQPKGQEHNTQPVGKHHTTPVQIPFDAFHPFPTGKVNCTDANPTQAEPENQADKTEKQRACYRLNVTDPSLQGKMELLEKYVQYEKDHPEEEPNTARVKIPRNQYTKPSTANTNQLVAQAKAKQNREDGERLKRQSDLYKLVRLGKLQVTEDNNFLVFTDMETSAIIETKVKISTGTPESDAFLQLQKQVSSDLYKLLRLGKLQVTEDNNSLVFTDTETSKIIATETEISTGTPESDAFLEFASLMQGSQTNVPEFDETKIAEIELTSKNTTKKSLTFDKQFLLHVGRWKCYLCGGWTNLEDFYTKDPTSTKNTRCTDCHGKDKVNKAAYKERQKEADNTNPPKRIRTVHVPSTPAQAKPTPTKHRMLDANSLAVRIECHGKTNKKAIYGILYLAGDQQHILQFATKEDCEEHWKTLAAQDPLDMKQALEKPTAGTIVGCQQAETLVGNRCRNYKIALKVTDVQNTYGGKTMHLEAYLQNHRLLRLFPKKLTPVNTEPFTGRLPNLTLHITCNSNLEGDAAEKDKCAELHLIPNDEGSSFVIYQGKKMSPAEFESKEVNNRGQNWTKTCKVHVENQPIMTVWNYLKNVLRMSEEQIGQYKRRASKPPGPTSKPDISNLLTAAASDQSDEPAAPARKRRRCDNNGAGIGDVERQLGDAEALRLAKHNSLQDKQAVDNCKQPTAALKRKAGYRELRKSKKQAKKDKVDKVSYTLNNSSMDWLLDNAQCRTLKQPDCDQNWVKEDRDQAPFLIESRELQQEEEANVSSLEKFIGVMPYVEAVQQPKLEQLAELNKIAASNSKFRKV